MTSNRLSINASNKRSWNQLSHKMAPCSLCNTDRRKEIITSTITDRSQAPTKRSPLYERLSENLSFAKLRSAVISSSASAMFVGCSDYMERMKRLCARLKTAGRVSAPGMRWSARPLPIKSVR